MLLVLSQFIIRFDLERINWSQEKEELLRKIANLESEKSVGRFPFCVMRSIWSSSWWSSSIQRPSTRMFVVLRWHSE